MSHEPSPADPAVPRRAPLAPGREGGALRNALTVDFEDWYHGIEIPLSEWSGFEDRIASSGTRLLDLFDGAGVKATFFVLGHLAERHPDLVREVARRGHEVATHGWSHTMIYHMTPSSFHDELKRSIELLEDLAGRPVRGHRAPYFSITERSLWAFDVMARLGIAYDSSVFPVAGYRYGIPSAPRWPYAVRAAGRELMEFPITVWRLAGQNLPVAGGAYFRMFPYLVTASAFRAINRGGHPVTFYLHPWEIDPKHPRIRLPRRIAATHYLNLGATEPRLLRLLHDFRFAPMAEVLGVA
jgi:polysaccharide deacetylase family protein (PEP-CTERM system associated)